MYTLFNMTPELNVPLLYPQNWHTVRAGLKENLVKVIRFYRQRPMAVASNHFIVRLLQSITVPKTQELLRYYDNVSAISLDLSMALKMTSSIYQGRVFPGVFYGPGVKEILIAVDTPIDPVRADKNWRNVCPIRVLRHPRSDLGMNLPDGEDTGSETGVAVVVINIPLLAIQYRAWRNEELAIHEQTGENMRSIMQFVHMYVLPNMLFSQTDVALFNRYHHTATGMPIGESYKKHSFQLVNYDNRVDAIIATQLEHLRKTKRSFASVLHNTPMVTKENVSDVLVMPEMVTTKQAIWALAIACAPGIEYLLSVTGEYAGYRNRQDLNKILRMMIRFESNAYLKSVLPDDLLYDILTEFKDIEMAAATA